MAAKITVKTPVESVSADPLGLPEQPGAGAVADLPFHFKNGRIMEGQQDTVVPNDASYRPSWDDWALSVAFVVAIRADCSRKQVGAVILDSNNHIVATGYNGAPSGEPGCKSMNACPRGQQSYEAIPAGSNYTGNCTAIHAEDNAIRQAQARGIDLSTCRLYATHQPCYGCKEVINNSGLTEAFIPNPAWGGDFSQTRIIPADLSE